NCRRQLAASLRRRHGAESALSMVKLVERRVQIGRIKIGPHALQEDKLSIRTLPEQKIRETFLTAGANEQIHFAAFRGQSATKSRPQPVQAADLIGAERRDCACRSTRDGFAR